MTLEAFKISIERLFGLKSKADISGIDILINVIGIITLALICFLAWNKRKYPKNGNKKPTKSLLVMANLYQWGIDVCPLLGTLGTVVALIVTTGSSGGEELKADFMYALTSTFWGLIWAVGCRFFESLCSLNGYYEALAEESESE